MAKGRGKSSRVEPKRQPPASSPISSAKPSARLSQWAPPVVLIITALLAYANSFGGPFIFDDILNIQNNYKIRHLTPLWDTMWGPLDTGVSGRPVVQMSYALNYAIHGLDVHGYHATNLTLHILASLVLFGVVRRTLLTPRLAPRFGERASVLALIVALVWQVHPLLSDSITYISGRTEVLGGLFLLLTLYAAIRATTSPRHARLWCIASILSCAIGTGCKEIMVSAPLLVILYDRLFVVDSFRQAFRTRWGLYAGLLATLALIPFNLSHADFHRPALVGQDQLNSWDHLKTQSQVLTLYLRLALWPHPLILDYFGWDAHPSLASVIPNALLILALLGVTAYGVQRVKPAAYAGAWFFLILAPTSSVLPLPTEIATERRMYLPLMGIVALVVLAIYRFVESRPSLQRGAVGVLSLVLLAEIGRTYWRNGDFNDPVNLWLDVAARRPNNARAFDNLAYEFLGRGDDASARQCFLEAIRLNPHNFKGMNNLATILMREGRDDEAMSYLQQALAVQPGYASPHLNLGRIHYKRGDLAAAEREIRESLTLQPDRVDSQVALAQVMNARGQFAEAERLCRAALQLDPQSASAYDQLGFAFAGSNNWADALRAFRTALGLAPNDTEYATHLAWHMAAAGDPAVRNPKDAIALASGVSNARRGEDPVALDALALAQAADAQFDAAAKTAQRALDLATAQHSARVPAIEQRRAAYAAGKMPSADLLIFGK